MKILEECYQSSAELLIPNFIFQDEGDDEYWSFYDSHSYYRRCSYKLLELRQFRQFCKHINIYSLRLFDLNLKFMRFSVRMRYTQFQCTYLQLVLVSVQEFHKLKALFYAHIRDKPPMKNAKDQERLC